MKRILSVTFMIVIIATMTIVTALDTLPDAEAFKKSQGVYNPKYGSDTKGIVCGDRLCSETMYKHTSNISDKKSNSSLTSLSGIIPVDSIVGGIVNNTEINKQSGTVIVSIESQDDGKVTLSLLDTIDDVFMVIVDDEEWDDVYVDGNKIHVYFYAGAETIEIFRTVSD